MSQIPSSNISLSYLSYLLYNSNINKPISFSSLYNFSSDSLPPYNSLNLNYFSSKYRNFLPSDIDSLFGWYDIKTSNSYKTIYNNASNSFNLTTNIKPVYNKYGLNTKQSILVNNNNYTINNINLLTSNITVGVVYNTSNYNRVIIGVFNFTVLDSSYYNPPSGNITYNNISSSFGFIVISDGTTKINGYTIPKGYQIWEVKNTRFYNIVAGGAKGDNYGSSQGGKGVVIKTIVKLTAGQYVIIATGKYANQGLCGGGGGTFITIYEATGNFNLASQHTILLIAGGGGGGGIYQRVYVNGENAVITTNAGYTTRNYQTVATNGGGGGSWYYSGGDGTDGTSYIYSSVYDSGGAGFIGNGGGINAFCPVVVSKSFLNGCYGSYIFFRGNYYGGFGGGGCKYVDNNYWMMSAGGGGGYSGGSAGTGGCGGGSYDINGINKNATLYTNWETNIFGPAPTTYSGGYNSGDGFVYIDYYDNISSDMFYGNEFNHINSNISINSNIYTSNIDKTGILISTLSITPNNTLKINTRYNTINNIDYNASGINYITLNDSNIFFKNFQGNVSEIVLYNSELSTSNIYLLESYLATKWWGNPSYLLKTDHMYYNLNPPSLINFPQLLYLFDTSTEISNNLLINRGNQGSLLNAIINNSYLNYSLTYSLNNNSLLIFYNFDYNNDNLGNLSSSYNFSINNGTPSYDNNNKMFGLSSIYLNNSSLLIPVSYDQSELDFSLNTEYTISFWYYINSYNILDSLIGINNDHNFILTRYSNTNDLIFENNIIIKNAGIVDNKWKNITITMKKNNNNCYVNIYYNSYLLISNYLLTNTWILTNNNYNYIILNKGNTDICYDNFRIYNRVLNTYEIQELLNLSISMQKSYNNNNYGYLIKNNYINLDYNNFKYIFFNNNQLTISFNLLIYNDLYVYTDVFYAYNIFKISFKNNYLDINYNNIRKTYSFINDFKSHNYKFVSNGMKLYIDNILNTEIIIYDEILNYITNDILNIISIGNYNNNQNYSPFLIENLQIYNYENYSTINYSDYPKYNYKIPFNSISFSKGFNKNIHLGPLYNDLLIPYNSSNLSWINNTNVFDVFNGIQKFTILANGYYDIVAAGAAGGFSVSSTKNNGRGIILNTISYLYENDIIYIVPGQKGGDGISGTYKTIYKLSGEGGGGGCSIVYNYTSNSIILIAGGGGGNSDTFIGKDATNITSGTTDTNNKGIVATNGNGGYSGNGAGGGYGVGGGGFYKNAQYVANYSGLSFLSIINNSNISISNDSNSKGGYGGFPCGANGGTNYNTISGVTNWIWGGGGGGGYSGGIGGSLALNGLTYGGGGGGSFDINSANNYGNIIIIYGTNGYNKTDGFINIKYITNDSYYIYANANNNIIYNGLILLLEPHNYNSFNETKPFTIINLINGNSCYVNKQISLINNYINFVLNTLIIPNNNILSITIFYKILINNNGLVFDDITNIDKCYINNNSNGNITTINNVSSIMNYITLIGFFNNNTITLFNNITSINVGCILCYNRIITFNEHLNNYNCYINKY
jgi:hypothetical protein